MFVINLFPCRGIHFMVNFLLEICKTSMCTEKGPHLNKSLLLCLRYGRS